MKNKQHQFILKAFVHSKVPRVADMDSFHKLVSLDSVLGGLCTQLLQGRKHLEIEHTTIVSKDDEKMFLRLINDAPADLKEELEIYYRISMLAQAIVLQYRA